MLKDNLNWNALPPETPPHIRTLLRRCLQKDPQKRLPQIGLVRIEIEEGQSGVLVSGSGVSQSFSPARPTPRRPLWKRAMPAVLSGVTAAALVGVFAARIRPAAPSQVIRFQTTLPQGVVYIAPPRQALAVSPDGSGFAFTTGAGLFLHTLSDNRTRQLVIGGIEGTMDTGSGTAERLTKADNGVAHIPESWAPDGKRILYAVSKANDVSLWVLSLQDRKTEPLGSVHSTKMTNATFSPDGRWIAYGSDESGTDVVYVQPFPATGAKYQISRGDVGHRPVWSRDGGPAVLHSRAGPLPRRRCDATTELHLRCTSSGTKSLHHRQRPDERPESRYCTRWPLSRNRKRRPGLVRARHSATR